MYDLQIIYGNKKDTLESVETCGYIQMHNKATGVYSNKPCDLASTVAMWPEIP